MHVSFKNRRFSIFFLPFRSKPIPPRLLPSERASLCEPGLSSGGLAEHLRAARAHDDGLGVREDGCDGEAAGALDVHEEASWCWDEGLELMLLGLGRWVWV